MAGGTKTKEIAKRYPCVDGIVSGTTTQIGHVMNLIPEQGSFYSRRLKRGL